MDTIRINTDENSNSVIEARRRANAKAGEQLTEPVVIAWKDDTSGKSAPEIPGGSAVRWQDYGLSNEGRLTVTVDGTFHFIFAESADFESPDLNVATLTESDGTHILCSKGACTEEERRRLGYFAGGGTGG